MSSISPLALVTGSAGESLSRYHAIERTSAKGEGQAFIGTCWQCGRTNLTSADVNQTCENIAGFSNQETLIMALALEWSATAGDTA